MNKSVKRGRNWSGRELGGKRAVSGCVKVVVGWILVTHGGNGGRRSFRHRHGVGVKNGVKRGSEADCRLNSLTQSLNESRKLSQKIIPTKQTVTPRYVTDNIARTPTLTACKLQISMCSIPHFFISESSPQDEYARLVRRLGY